MSVRISATDWAGEDGITPDDAVEIGEAFAREGADLIDVSAGQTWADAQPVYGRMFQTPFSDRSATRASSRPWRSATSTSPTTPTRSSPPAAPIWSRWRGRTSIDPFWTLRAAAQLDYRDIHFPPQYLNGMSQLARNLKREAEAAAALKV